MADRHSPDLMDAIHAAKLDNPDPMDMSQWRPLCGTTTDKVRIPDSLIGQFSPIVTINQDAVTCTACLAIMGTPQNEEPLPMEWATQAYLNLAAILDDPTSEISDNTIRAFLEQAPTDIRAVADAVRAGSIEAHTCDTPHLGLATTRELIDEIASRIEADYASGGGGLYYTTVHGRPELTTPVEVGR